MYDTWYVTRVLAFLLRHMVGRSISWLAYLTAAYELIRGCQFFFSFLIYTLDYFKEECLHLMHQ